MADIPLADVPLADAPPRCANCGVAMQGPYCHACGQSAEDFERSVGSLLTETVEHLFHTDGRLVRTLPRLIFKPALLTNDYLAGRRAAQTPPLRLFLVIVLLFFLAGSLGEMVHPFGPLFISDSPAGGVPTLSPGQNPITQGLAAWLNPRLVFAAAHQREFAMAAGAWLHRIAILFLPISTLLLAVLFRSKRRRIFLFDHAIFSMHSLSFMGLLFTLMTLMSVAAPLRGLAPPLVLAAPVHLFVHLRGVYGVSVPGTLVRMLLLFIASAAAIVLLLLGVAGLGLSGMGTA
jgi:hypothetical protein